MAKKISIKRIGSGLKGKTAPHLKTAAAFLGVESILRELPKIVKEKISEEAPRGKLLSVIMELPTDTQEKLARHLKSAKRKRTENKLVSLLCKLEAAQKVVEDPKTKKKVLVGSYKEALEKLINLPEKGDGLTFGVALDLLEHDKWQQLAQRGLKIIKKDVPKKIEKEVCSFATEMNNLCDEINVLF